MVAEDNVVVYLKHITVITVGEVFDLHLLKATKGESELLSDFPSNFSAAPLLPVSVEILSEISKLSRYEMIS